MSSLQYATLQEAWGDALPPVRRRRKHKNDAPVGVADDREYRASRVPGDIEYRAVSSADDYLAWTEYAKEPGQRTDAPLLGHDGPERHFPAEAKVDPADVGAAPAEPPAQYTAPVPLDSTSFNGNPIEGGDGFAAYDVAMYIFTGIMLILLLEQFVQMGVAMRPTVSLPSW